jgi:hypothetical protein
LNCSHLWSKVVREDVVFFGLNDIIGTFHGESLLFIIVLDFPLDRRIRDDCIDFNTVRVILHRNGPFLDLPDFVDLSLSHFLEIGNVLPHLDDFGFHPVSS